MIASALASFFACSTAACLPTYAVCSTISKITRQGVVQIDVEEPEGPLDQMVMDEVRALRPQVIDSLPPEACLVALAMSHPSASSASVPAPTTLSHQSTPCPAAVQLPSLISPLSHSPLPYSLLHRCLTASVHWLTIDAVGAQGGSG